VKRMDQSNLQGSIQASIADFRNNLEKSIREMIKNLPTDAAPNVNVGIDGASVLGENFIEDLNAKVQEIISSSLELAKQAVEDGVSVSNMQGTPGISETTHKMINGETVE